MLYILGIYLVIVSGIVYTVEGIFNIPMVIVIIAYLLTIREIESWPSLDPGKKMVMRFFWSLMLAFSLERTIMAISIITDTYAALMKYDNILFLTDFIVMVLIYFRFSATYLEEAFKK